MINIIIYQTASVSHDRFQNNKRNSIYKINEKHETLKAIFCILPNIITHVRVVKSLVFLVFSILED